MKRHIGNQSPEFAFRYIFFDMKEVARLLVTVLSAFFSMSVVLFCLQYASDSMFKWAVRSGYDRTFSDLLNDSFPSNLFGWGIMLFPVIFMIWTYHVVGSAFEVYGKKRSAFINALKITGKHDRDAIAVPAGEFLFYFCIVMFAGVMPSLVLCKHEFNVIYESGISFAPAVIGYAPFVFTMLSGIICIFGCSLKAFYRQKSSSGIVSLKKRKHMISRPVTLVTVVAILAILGGQYIAYTARGLCFENDYDFSITSYADIKAVRNTQKNLMETGAFDYSYILAGDEEFCRMTYEDVTDDSENQNDEEITTDQVLLKIILNAKDEDSYLKARDSISENKIAFETDTTHAVLWNRKMMSEDPDKTRDILVKAGMPLYNAMDLFVYHTGRDRMFSSVNFLVSVMIGSVWLNCIILVINKNHAKSEEFIRDITSEIDEKPQDPERKIVNRTALTAVVSTLVGSLIIIPLYLLEGDLMLVVYSLIIMAVNVVLALLTIRRRKDEKTDFSYNSDWQQGGSAEQTV
jgi:hypothetical protein